MKGTVWRTPVFSRGLFARYLRVMRTLIAFVLITAIAPIATAEPRRPMTIVHEFHVSEPGGETIKPLKQMSKAEVQAIVTTGCTALAHGCPKGVHQIEPAEKVPGMVIAEGENVYITGQVVRQQGDEWWGIYAAPKGYTACRAALGKVSLTAGSVFDTTIKSQATAKGLLFHAVIPIGTPDRPSSVHAYFLVQYVPVGTEGRLGCMSDGSNPWRCVGSRDCQRIVGSLNYRYRGHPAR